MVLIKLLQGRKNGARLKSQLIVISNLRSAETAINETAIHGRRGKGPNAMPIFAAVRQAFHHLIESAPSLAPALWPSVTVAETSGFPSLTELLPDELVALAELRHVSNTFKDGAVEISGAVLGSANEFAGTMKEASGMMGRAIEAQGLFAGLAMTCGAAVWSLYGTFPTLEVP